MKHIVKRARFVSKKGCVVLLSPAIASFRLFKNYIDQGNQFQKTVYSLVE
jgi:UDP-N-acetylmuramoylalanine--D-glutamate ligase